MPTRRFAPLAALLVLAFSRAVFAQSDKSAAVDPAEWAPADSFVYVGVSDVEQVWTAWQKTNAYAMFQDPTIKKEASLNVVSTAIEAFQERLAKALGVEVKQLKNPFKGPVAFYLAAPKGGTEKDIQPGLIASVGDAGAMKKYYDNAIAKLKNAYDKHESVSAGSNSIEFFSRDPNAPPKSESEEGTDVEDDDDDAEGDLDEAQNVIAEQVNAQLDELFSSDSLPASLAVCLTPERLFVGASADQVKQMLRREKKGDVIADSDDYKSLVKLMKPAGPVRFLINIPRIAEFGRGEGDETAEHEKMMKTLGVDGMRSFVGQMQIGGESFESRFDGVLLLKGERSGLAKIFSMDNRPLPPAADIADTTSWYAAVNLQPPKLLDEIERMIRQQDPADADKMRASLEAVPMGPGGETVNMRKDFIDLLKAPLTFQLGFSRPIGADSLRGLLSIGHKDRDAISSFLGKFAAFLKPRDVRGTQIYESPFGFAVGASSDRLLVGNGAAVEAALDAKGGSPLADTPAWKLVAKNAPEQAWLLFYSNDRQSLEAALELSKHRDALARDPSGALAMGLLEMYGVGDDEKSINAARKLLKYAGCSFATIATTEEGIAFRVASIKLPE